MILLEFVVLPHFKNEGKNECLSSNTALNKHKKYNN